MTATYSEAIDAIFSQFKTVWDAGAASIVGIIPQIRWQGVEGKEPPSADVFWCRVSVQSVFEAQSSLKVGVASNEGRRYTSTGLVFVQLFCPMSDAQAYIKGRQLAELAKSAFRGKATSNGVWFRNARINELPPEDKAYRFNIVAETEYDEIA